MRGDAEAVEGAGLREEERAGADGADARRDLRRAPEPREESPRRERLAEARAAPAHGEHRVTAPGAHRGQLARGEADARGAPHDAAALGRYDDLVAGLARVPRHAGEHLRRAEDVEPLGPVERDEEDPLHWQNLDIFGIPARAPGATSGVTRNFP